MSRSVHISETFQHFKYVRYRYGRSEATLLGMVDQPSALPWGLWLALALDEGPDIRQRQLFSIGTVRFRMAASCVTETSEYAQFVHDNAR